MSGVDYASGEILDAQEAERLITDFMSSFVDSLVDSVREVDIFEGLDQKTITHLKSVLAGNPNLRPALRKAALYRRAHPRQTKTSARFVYFIQSSGGPIKIGSASDVAARLKSLQTGSADELTLLAMTEGGEFRERELHARFAADRLRGEWFAPSPELIRVIRDAS